jgi:hypothetical protein
MRVVQIVLLFVPHLLLKLKPLRLYLLDLFVINFSFYLQLSLFLLESLIQHIDLNSSLFELFSDLLIFVLSFWQQLSIVAQLTIQLDNFGVIL